VLVMGNHFSVSFQNFVSQTLNINEISALTFYVSLWASRIICYRAQLAISLSFPFSFYKSHKGNDYALFITISPKRPAQSLAHGRWSLNICWLTTNKFIGCSLCEVMYLILIIAP
jgi:hypothetical protein